MYLVLVLLPLWGALSAGLGGRWLGGRGAVVVTTGCLGLSAALSLLAFYEVALAQSPCDYALLPWIQVGLLEVQWSLFFDTLTVTMLVVITSISFLVHAYSWSYMGEDPHLPRFMSYLSLFTFAMVLLVTGENLVQLFLGWEGVGLASYLLINFWFTRPSANRSSIKAMVMNRIGDVGLALGILTAYHLTGAVDYPTLVAVAPHLQEATLSWWGGEVHGLTLMALLLFLGAVGKSAQLGLHTWLPDAMEGPTPVSALIHAATMVTAGVFLLVRLSPLLEYAPSALSVITLVGACTSVFAATTATVQQDLKRVIAYSTASQLGYMVVLCGLSHYAIAMYHLVTHAYFKALLFLGAGSVIHALSDEQDMRRMGGLARLLPITYGLMLVGTLAIVGAPFLSGFYSKDLMLEVTATSHWAAAWMLYGVVFCTAYYSFRLLFLTFLAPPAMERVRCGRVHEAPLAMLWPLLLLACGSLWVGYVARDMMVGVGTPFWSHSLLTLDTPHLMEAECLSQTVRLLPLWLTLAGGCVALLVVFSARARGVRRGLYLFLNQRWFVDRVYNALVALPLVRTGLSVTLRALDRGALEHLGPTGIATTLSRVARRLRALQGGALAQYALVMILGMVWCVALMTLMPQSMLDGRLVVVSLAVLPLVLFFS
jgi:proton-translocating NADH-quinone oxidoreductase chain L